MNRLIKLVQAAVAAAATALVTGPRPAISQVKAPTTMVKTMPLLVVAAPQGLSVAATTGGPQLTWQKSANAASYRVQRATTASSAPVTLATVAATTLSYVDQGYAVAAVYSVVAVGSRGQTAASAGVSYAPPAPVTTGVSAVGTPIVTKPGVAPTGTAIASTTPEITSVGAPDATGQVVLHMGDTVTATGTGLSGLSSLRFTGSFCPGDLTTCRPNPYDKGTPATLLGASATSARFVVPTVTLPYAGPAGSSEVYYYIIATRGLLADTTAKFLLGAKTVVRQITEAQPRTVLAGQTVSIAGVGLETMEGAYFGSGVAGSTTNPLFSVVAASTSASLRIPSQCDQQGILMLSDLNPTHPATAISAGAPITLTCVSSAPTGHIVGTESGAIVYVKPGGTVTIQGTSLSIVTDVVDFATGTHFSFARSNNGSTQSLVVALPANATRFVPTLVSPLPTGVAPGTVTGTALVMQPPTWSAVAPAWSEPLEVVRLIGHNLSNGGAPTVTVGGVAAQVTSYDDLNVYFRLGPNTTSGPIVVQNAGGSVQASGSFPSSSGATVPGFFVVSGASTITEIIKPKPTIGFGDTLIVHGQNLAPLGGICVSLPTASPSNGQMAYVPLMRVPAPAGRGFEASNTEMLVQFSRDPTSMVSAPVKLFSVLGASDYMTDLALFSCNTNPGGVSLP